jgi:hypothetical protein
MSRRRSAKAKQVLAALLRIGPSLLAQIARKTGLQPEDL